MNVTDTSFSSQTEWQFLSLFRVSCSSAGMYRNMRSWASGTDELDVFVCAKFPWQQSFLLIKGTFNCINYAKQGNLIIMWLISCTLVKLTFGLGMTWRIWCAFAGCFLKQCSSWLLTIIIIAKCFGENRFSPLHLDAFCDRQWQCCFRIISIIL